MEMMLTVSYVAPDNGDKACLLVCVKHRDAMIVINSFYGTEAEQLYWKLTKLEAPTNMVPVSTAPEDKHWLRAFLMKPIPSGVRPFVIPVEDKKESPQPEPGALLHNKDCPYGYKCRAIDCIECMEIYGRENEES